MKNSKVLVSAYYQEWAFVYGRKFLLSILALGSILITHKIGTYIADLLFPENPIFHFTVTVFFVGLGWAGIDWVLANALSSASSIDEEEDENAIKAKRPVWFFAIAALISTLLLSLSSNFFISSQLAGKSHLSDFNEQVKQTMAQDSVLKTQAFQSLEAASAEQSELVVAALAEKKRMVKEAVSKGTPSWRNDYKHGKHNPEGYFWRCTDCPSKYKQYRKSIELAIEEGDKLVNEAKGHKKFVQQSLSPTLTYQPANDSMLITVKANTIQLEQERKEREGNLNVVLLAMTLGCAILALIITYVLREHRKRYGQQVIENNVKLIMFLVDISQRFGNGIAAIIYTLVVQPFNFLQRKGLVKRYELAQHAFAIPQSNASVTANNTSVQRSCQNCQTDISHKRSDAKFCSDTCRMDYHNFIPHKKNGKVKV